MPKKSTFGDAFGVDDPAYQDFVQSEEFRGLSNKDKWEYIDAFRALTPTERKEFVYGSKDYRGLTLQPKESPEATQREVAGALERTSAVQPGAPREVAAGAVDLGGSLLGGVVGGAINPALAAPGAALGAVGADRLNRALGLRSQETIDNLPFVGGLPNKRLFGTPVTTGDVAALVPDIALGAARGVSKFMTLPARRALREHDKALAGSKQKARAALDKAEAVAQAKTEANVAGYERQVADVHAYNLEQQTLAEERNLAEQARYGTQTRNEMERLAAARLDQQQALAQARSKWEEVGKQIDEQFKVDMDNIAKNKALDAQEKAADLQARRTQWQAQRAQHNKAYMESPLQATRDVQVGDYGRLYDEAQEMAGSASPVDVSRFRDTAQALKVDFELPAEGVQSRYRHITEALSELGLVRSEKGEITGAEAVPLSRIIETQKRLGQQVRTLSRGNQREEYGAAKKLFTALGDTVNDAAKLDASVAAAAEKQAEANLAFMRHRLVEEYKEIWDNAARPSQDTRTYRIQRQKLLDGWREFVEDNPFVHKGLDPAELRIMEETINRAPADLPAYPTERRPPPTTSRERTRQDAYERQIEEWIRNEPPSESGPLRTTPRSVEPPKVYTSKRKEYPTTPEPVGLEFPVGATSEFPPKPSIGRLPLGEIIMTKIAGSEAGGRLRGYGGPDPISGIELAAGAVVIPHYLSKALLANQDRVATFLEKNFKVSGQDIVRKVIDGEVRLPSSAHAAVIALARNLHKKEQRDKK